ncbi:LytR C-terminal domain-containing protein [Streptomyces sp. NBC_01476]|uniref:LytR C-terminal domain-containing protein n=1 Tax=Streptomyces sp. NBC_01476 TaxID=2903881 RepID=UPI002E2F6151|nr:LytR C-terminal domain-containing protein [Streptomyces sp. NBC_01476]
MSMLTPSGMGGKYRVTGNAYPRMRRPRRRGRILAAVVASVVVLGLFGWGALQLFHVFNGDNGDTKANAAPQNQVTCKPAPTPAHTGKPTPLPQPSGVTLNVLNATSRGGLAKTTADALASRGFKVAKFGNATAPYDQKVTQSALLVAGPAGEAAAREAGTQVAGSTVKIDPARKDKTVDLLIGDGFAALASPADAARARVVAANPPPPKPVCGPVASGSSTGKTTGKSTDATGDKAGGTADGKATSKP